jgi:uncharacterized membrane protein YgdD (TMEM256/DUF423 family)
MAQIEYDSVPALRPALFLSGVMGATGIALAAASAHQPDASRLASASSMLLFHASAVIGVVLLTARGLAHRQLGMIAVWGFIAGSGLFAGDLVLRQYAGRSLFPMAAPTGGTLLIVSWLVLALAAAWARKTP